MTSPLSVKADDEVESEDAFAVLEELVSFLEVLQMEGELHSLQFINLLEL